DHDRRFAFGIDPVDGDLPSDRRDDWPGLREVRAYIRRTRDTVNRAALSGRADSTRWHIAFEHRLMHAETLAYALNQMPLEVKLAPRASAPSRRAARSDAGPVGIPAGVATLGRARRDEGFGWDNEYEGHQVEVPAFTIDRHDVTNGEFLEFARAGCYRDRSL